MDELLVLPEPGMNTLLKAFQSQVKKMPNHQFLGKKGNIAYDWMTYAQVETQAKAFAAGCVALDLIPEVEGEGR